jgi:5-(carboxyamino)imidazole ribonucleotide synthase
MRDQGQHERQDDVTTMTGKSEAPLPPGSCIGILGGGQLGRMLALAAARLGFRTAVYAEDGENPAFDVAKAARAGAYDDPDGLAWLAEVADVVTYEFENVPVATASILARSRPVLPGVKALEVAQDRLVEKRFIAEAGLPVATHWRVDNADDLKAAIREADAPCLLKTRRLGYDGKGQVPFAPGDDPQAAFAAVGQAPSVLEARVAFDGELSAIVVRAADGAMAAYDVPENVHEGGILRRSTVPSRFSEQTRLKAVAMAQKLAVELDYIGVLAVEFFVTRDPANPLIVNEIAPRVHNSGHWTMDACVCDQFENHIRAIAGWPLGDTTRIADATMINLIGDDISAWPALADEPGAVLHHYGKAEVRAGRKLGHLNRIKPLS